MLSALGGMLKFNAKERITVDEVLRHPAFMDIRRKELEITSPTLVKIPIDSVPKLTEAELRSGFQKETIYSVRFRPSRGVPCFDWRTGCLETAPNLGRHLTDSGQAACILL